MTGVGLYETVVCRKIIIYVKVVNHSSDYYLFWFSIAERANRILLKMEKLYEEGHSDAIANSRCYSAALTAWARSRSPDAVGQAFDLIDRMEQNGRDGSPHSKPNAHCYNACIHTIAKSHQPGKARKCREVLQRMIAAKDNGFYESAPNLVTYSTIINGEWIERLLPPEHFISSCPYLTSASCSSFI